MRRTLALAALLATATLGGTAGAATVDPAAVALQAAIKHQLQLKLNQSVKGMKVKTVTCTVAKNGRSGTCKANFTYKTLRGYYTVTAKMPPKGQVYWTTTGLHCFVAKSGAKVKC
jgi:hypothetical protein